MDLSCEVICRSGHKDIGRFEISVLDVRAVSSSVSDESMPGAAVHEIPTTACQVPPAVHETRGVLRCKHVDVRCSEQCARQQ